MQGVWNEKTKVMIMNGTAKTERDAAVYCVRQSAIGADDSS